MSQDTNGIESRTNRRAAHRWRRGSADTDRVQELTEPTRAYDGPPKRRCACGVCRDCVENARWERVFAEKFADPDYYQRRPISFSSPLSTL